MAKKTILFDLDGTLTDSAEGITNSVRLVMQHFGLPIPSQEVLHTFVGPPLHDMFIKHGVPEARVEEAIQVFRSRYVTIGKFENRPYDGIPGLLEALKSKGYTLLVATSKPQPQAIEILEHFKLASFFDCICGASLDRSRVSKEDVIAYLLKHHTGNGELLMVGDTVYDILGAAAHQIPGIGVSWGYGSVAEMRKAGAVAIADTPQELLKLLSN